MLQGAKAIALPLQVGQRMSVKNARGSDLIWEALDENGEVWFDAQISLYDFSAIKTSDEELARKLRKILRSAVRANSEFLSTWSGFKVETQLEFPIEWGFGSSSTLISNIAQWADINPFHFYFSLFNGSGYDIACAEAEEAIQYRLGDDNLHFSEFEFKPSFLSKLFFVYQGKKQDSEASLKIHGKKFRKAPKVIERITEISDEIASIKSFSKFNSLIEEHESLIGETIGHTPIKEEKYKDFSGSIKSLGAWGGDFILVSTDKGQEYVENYFNSKKLNIVKPYLSLVSTRNP